MKFLVGIDLGTSNCAMAFTDPAQGPQAALEVFLVLQIQRPGEVSPQALLPSCLYLPGEHELPQGAAALPWPSESRALIGEVARWQGTRVPGRLVASAKSWLCHPGVDRTAPILPWGAPTDLQKLSPVQASALLLDHMRRAWDHSHPEAPLSEQEIVITVPASFDEVARSLTVAAARRAGLEKFTLLEEPQAAFYDFTAQHRHDLATTLADLRLVLVVDVGGGTSDFTLVQVGTSEEGPLMRRIAVGEHLMLGGDNMDAALARAAEQIMTSGGRKLSPGQWSQLTQAARVAKETLLNENSPAEFNLSIVSEGSRLIGGSLSAKLHRHDIERLVLDGFLPPCAPDDEPRRGTRVALQELGLPYVQDPAITRHLAAFLRAHADSARTALGISGTDLPRPDAILLNGGVFNAARIASRLIEVVSRWWPEQPQIPLLCHESLDLAVARGAAFYGLVKHGLGRRISGGAAHALYVGMEKSGETSARAICVVPRGQEEGESVEIREKVFQLQLGRPVRFPLYSSASDRFEKTGDVVTVSDDMQPLPPIHALLKGSGGKSGMVPVHLRSTLTEIGTLELWCVANTGKDTWRLEFELRSGAAEAAPVTVESMPTGFTQARLWIDHVFGGKSKPLPGAPGPREPKHLWNGLETTLGAREQWRLPVLRELWGALYAGAAKRRRTAAHEKVFYQLLGYTLRPGYGYPLDDWRSEQSATLFPGGVEFHKDKAVWVEFWVCWRRLAGGLKEERQQQIWSYLQPHLANRIPPAPPKNAQRPKGIQPEGLDEMVRLAAALEHLEVSQKIELGNWIAGRLRSHPSSGPWAWALGRIGARALIHGSLHRTVPPDLAADWVDLLADPALLKLEGSAFALTQLAQMTGDRARDLPEAARLRALSALQAAQAPPGWTRLLTEVSTLAAEDKARALGDTLPVGLVLAD